MCYRKIDGGELNGGNIGNLLQLRKVMLSRHIKRFSSIVSKGAMNSFKEMFPLVRMFPLAVKHTPPISKRTLKISSQIRANENATKLTARTIQINLRFGSNWMHFLERSFQGLFY